MHCREPWLPGRRHVVARGVHAQWAQHALLHHLVKPLVCDALDDLADPVKADPILPLLTRIAHERERWQGRLGQVLHAQLPVLQDQLEVRFVKRLVRKARCVGQQMARRDVAHWRPQLGVALGIEAFEDLHLTEVRRVLPRRGVQVEPALLDQLQRAGGGQRLGARVDAHHGVERHVAVGAQASLPRAPLVDVPVAVRDDGDDARHTGRPRRRLVQHVVAAFRQRRLQRSGREGAQQLSLQSSIGRPQPLQHLQRR
mmetsp:Transcript_38532/g.99571  ORF Transcript_38532/g.99571 Transcript_38532/m.99571 type:complete len:256 (+) Transcript_38532:669-1436(+)